MSGCGKKVSLAAFTGAANSLDRLPIWLKLLPKQSVQWL